MIKQLMFGFQYGQLTSCFIRVICCRSNTNQRSVQIKHTLNTEFFIKVLFLVFQIASDFPEFVQPEGILSPELNGSMPYSGVWGDLKSIVPSDIDIQPNFMNAQAQTYAGQINGRLLSPQEGCGASGAGFNRVVGGAVAPHGECNKIITLKYVNLNNGIFLQSSFIGAWPWFVRKINSKAIGHKTQ